MELSKAEIEQVPSHDWQVASSRETHDDPLLRCLVLLTKLLNDPFSADALIAGLPLVDNRLTPELLLRAAERAHLSASIVRRPLAQISSLVLPAILLLKEGKACVLEKLTAEGLCRILTPESRGGEKQLPLAELETFYSGYAIFIQPTHHFDARTEDTVIPQVDRWFWDTLKKSWPIYSQVVVASLFVNLFGLASPLFTMNVYDRVVPNQAIETLWVLAIGVFIVFLFELLMKTLRGYFIDTAGKRTDILLSSSVFSRVMNMKMAARPASVGAFANSLQEFESFRTFFTSASLSAIIDLPFVFLFILILWMIGGPLAFIPLAIIPLAIGFGLLMQIPLGRTVETLFRHASQKNATLIESLSGLETLKAMGAESATQRRWEKNIGFIAKLGVRIQFLSQSATNVTVFLQQLATILVVIYGVYLIGDGELTVGALIACTILTGRTLAPMTQIAATLTRYHQARASMHSMNNLMKLPLETPAGKDFLHRAQLKGSIEFSNVHFRYPDQDINTLSGVSFKINPGEKVGIIGRVGSGKSTLEKMMLGLYDPTEGSVLVDGTDIRQIHPADLRRNIGYVPQDIVLFYGSVKDNISIGAPYTDDTAILKAAALAGVTDFVQRHPKGFDLQVGERGERLSGGQRQTIAVARGLLGHPPILLLDEPTNSMDSSTEHQFIQKLSDSLKEQTLILITHRASILSLVNRVIIIDAGKVVADGPKEHVLEALKQGKFKMGKMGAP